jgi:hypothetical protein
MKSNLASKFFNRLFSNVDGESMYEVPEVSELVFWAVFLLAFLVAIVFAPLRRWL